MKDLLPMRVTTCFILYFYYHLGPPIEIEEKESTHCHKYHRQHGTAVSHFLPGISTQQYSPHTYIHLYL